MTQTPEQRYRQRRDEAAARHDQLDARAGHVANFRLAAFILGIAALVWAEVRPETGAIAFALLALAVIAFVGLIGVHSRLTERARRAAELAAVNDEGIARIDRDWDRLPRGPAAGPPGHPFAHDLDLFGRASIARLLTTTGTAVGRERLHDWLLAPAPLDEARRRQAAVRELAHLIDFRQELQVAGRLSGDADRRTLDAFLDWAEAAPWVLRRTLLLWAARLLPAATLVLLALHIDGVWTQGWWGASLAATAILAMAVRKPVHNRLDSASLGDASLRHFAGVVRVIQDREPEAPALREIHDALSAETDARAELERLGWLSELADLRHSGMFYLIIHFTTLWDVHVLWGLERWRRRAGPHVRGWIDRIARMDALAALAHLPLDEDGWCFPDLDDHADSLTARGLAHPLLDSRERVPNDVAVGPPGSFLMVTGSNMSGKSTLLRAIGVNAVLAGAGGPVCAAALTIPRLDLRTSMRVEDSLERGVSLFMAELQQLKRVVDAADAAPPIVLYLLDEILHGTNTAERQVAVREVIAHLLRSPAIGAISTHDLELADAGPLADAVVPVHFRETIHPEGHAPPMTFDYLLRPGIATSTNALKLVRLVGLARD